MRKNDSEKISELYQLYEQMMFAEANAILNDVQLAEDAVHEAFVRPIASRDRIGDPELEATRAYVRRTLKSTAIDIYRKNRRWREYSFDAELIDETVGEEDVSAQSAVGLIAHLPDSLAAVARCRIIHGLSVHETAAVLKLSEACVKKRLERARARLRELL